MNNFKINDLVKIKNLKHEWIMGEVTNVTVSRLAVKEVDSGNTVVVHYRDAKDAFKQARTLIDELEKTA